MTAKPTIIPLARIKRMKPCGYQDNTGDYGVLMRLYPNGVPLTARAALAIQEAGGDVLWGLVRLMTKPQRQDFILYSLRLRQPWLIKLFRKAGLPQHARALAKLRFDTVADAQAAVPI